MTRDAVIVLLTPFSAASVDREEVLQEPDVLGFSIVSLFSLISLFSLSSLDLLDSLDSVLKLNPAIEPVVASERLEDTTSQDVELATRRGAYRCPSRHRRASDLMRFARSPAFRN